MKKNAKFTKREYLFRAKDYSGDDMRPYKKGWVYGDLMKDEWFTYGMTAGSDSDLCRETVGQWTGMFDKDGKLIYEGDIISSIPAFSFDEEKAEVLHAPGGLSFVRPLDNGGTYALAFCSNIKVIGHIYEDKEYPEED